MEFKCIYHDEPVGECPPVKELERLRQENRELRERIREMEDAGERARPEAPLREDGGDTSSVAAGDTFPSEGKALEETMSG